MSFKLYLDESKDKSKIVKYVDLYFDSIIHKMKLNERDIKYLKTIDEAEYLKNGSVTTPFGTTDIRNISTGCKTLILINHSKELGDLIISISECGDNVLDIVFALDSCKVYLSFFLMPDTFDTKKKITVVKNGREREIALEKLFRGVL